MDSYWAMIEAAENALKSIPAGASQVLVTKTERINAQESAKIADANEIMRFYTSVMRGEVLDQFGIEASLDTRIKAANELAKHKIEIPLKLEQKNITNNIGSITLNFVPRNKEIEVFDA